MKPLQPALVRAECRRLVSSPLAGLAAAILVCALALPLAGWSNGPDRGDGFGTHDWVLYQANRLAAARGRTWLVWPTAQSVTDDPDIVLHDYAHHVYDVWGSHYGDAPARVRQLYDEAVAELRSGDATAASETFGLLSHYYADICDPLHTDQCDEEDRMHGRYETAVERLTDEPDENAGWVSSDGVERVADVAEKTREAASFAHESYRALVDGYSTEGMSGETLAITRSSLNRAVNDLADLISSAAFDSARMRSALVAGLSATGSTMPSATQASQAAPASAVALSSAPDAQPETGVAPAATRGSRGGEGGSRVSWLTPVAVVAGVFTAALFGALHARRGRRSL